MRTALALQVDRRRPYQFLKVRGGDLLVSSIGEHAPQSNANFLNQLVCLDARHVKSSDGTLQCEPESRDELLDRLRQMLGLIERRLRLGDDPKRGRCSHFSLRNCGGMSAGA